jgi:predicted transcriptional regulator
MTNEIESWQESPIRTVREFRSTFIQLRYNSRITRAQVIFLCYLVHSGYVKQFTVTGVLSPGLSWSLARQYLACLKMIGFTVKTGKYYMITPAGWKYYNLFMEEFTDRINAPAKWQ